MSDDDFERVAIFTTSITSRYHENLSKYASSVSQGWRDVQWFCQSNNQQTAVATCSENVISFSRQKWLIIIIMSANSSQHFSNSSNAPPLGRAAKPREIHTPIGNTPIKTPAILNYILLLFCYLHIKKQYKIILYKKCDVIVWKIKKRENTDKLTNWLDFVTLCFARSENISRRVLHVYANVKQIKQIYTYQEINISMEFKENNELI